jgi:hypothetical protein
LSVVGRARCRRGRPPSPHRRLDRDLDQLGAIFGGLRLQVSGNLADRELGAERLVLPDVIAFIAQVDDTDELGLGADRQLQRQRPRAEAAP